MPELPSPFSIRAITRKNSAAGCVPPEGEVCSNVSSQLAAEAEAVVLASTAAVVVSKLQNSALPSDEELSFAVPHRQ